MFMVKKKKDTKKHHWHLSAFVLPSPWGILEKKGRYGERLKEKEWLVSDPNEMKEIVTIQKQFDIFHVFPSELMCK